MSVRDALVRALRGSGTADVDDLQARLRSEGAAIVMVDDLAEGIHGTFCGANPDHAGPNENDRQQADVLMRILHSRVG